MACTFMQMSSTRSSQSRVRRNPVPPWAFVSVKTEDSMGRKRTKVMCGRMRTTGSRLKVWQMLNMRARPVQKRMNASSIMSTTVRARALTVMGSAIAAAAVPL
jgi:hypothetical protein